MKQFLKYIIKLIFLLFIILVFLDVTYTFVKVNSRPRNKIDHIITSKNENYDIVIMGSSRAENHIVPQVFINKGYKTFNFGMSGASLNENLLQLEIMLENNYKIKNIILQTDINIASTGYSEGTKAAFMPYIYYKKSILKHYKDSSDINEIMCFPFYRYISNESKIGFREFFFSTINKKTNFRDNEGFDGLASTNSLLSYPKSTKKIERNLLYEHFKKICKTNNINLISITTPICGNDRQYFNNVIILYPEIKDFHSVINDDKYFASCGHMNENGAKLFTKIISNSISLK